MAERYGRKYAKDEDFKEEEVWGVIEDRKEMVNSSQKLRKSMKDSSIFTTSSSSPGKFTNFTATRMIPKSSSSEIITESNKKSSAPLDIPDWSKIYGKTSKKKKNGTTSSSWVNYNYTNNNIINVNVNDQHDGYYYTNSMMGDQHHHYFNGYNECNGHGNDDDDRGGGGEDDGDDIDGMVPPHEYIARKLARNQISSFSVYEGIGRTLKGRDLSKVRNTILSKTGFLE